MLKKIIFLIGTLLLTSIVAYASVVALSDTYRVELGQHTFEIPKQYSREGWMPQWLSSAPGLDDGSRAYLLEFPAEELAEEEGADAAALLARVEDRVPVGVVDLVAVPRLPVGEDLEELLPLADSQPLDAREGGRPVSLKFGAHDRTPSFARGC